MLQNCKDFGETASIQKEGEDWMRKYILLGYVSFVFFFLLNNLFLFVCKYHMCLFECRTIGVLGGEVKAVVSHPSWVLTLAHRSSGRADNALKY